MEVSAQTPNPPSFSSQSPRRVQAPRSSSAAPLNEDKSKQKQAEREQQQQEQKILQQLRARDREVRAHEAAHVAAAGEYVASGPSYTYQRGPDGNVYAIGGEVRLDSSTEADPEKQLDKAETVRRAALAPAQPSPQDLSVAANATRSAAQARIEIAVQRRDEAEAQRQELESSTEDARESSRAENTEAENETPDSGSTDGNESPAPTADSSVPSNNNPASLYTQPSRPVGADFSQFV